MRKLQLFIGLLFLAFNLSAARTLIIDKNVTLHMNNVPMETFLEEIRKQTGVNILYNAQAFKDTKPVSATAKNEPWTSVLKRVLSSHDFTYGMEGDIVVIYKNGTAGKTRKITGKVYDEDGNPMIGARVTIKCSNGSDYYTVTNNDGLFSFNCKGNERSIVITYIGYETSKQHLRNDKTEYTFSLKEDSQTLDELVVTGYQTIDKRKLTSAISSLTEDDLNFQGALTVDQMLEGKIPGLLTMTTTTAPGASTKMRLRGTSTFTGSREPLWVIDGIIYENPVPLSADEINSWDNINLIGNAITGLNPQDIARIDVLKDASATAIYGTRAANGVIVITTKTGKVGKTSVSYNFNAQVQRRPMYSDFELMTSKERIDVSREIMNRGLYFQSMPDRYGYEGAMMDYWDKKISFSEFQQQVSQMEANNTDWFGELYRTAFSQTHSISLSGGNEGTRYYFSVGFNDDKGTEIGSDLKRITARMNLSSRLRENLMVDVRLSGSVQDAHYNPSEYSVFDEAYYTSRIFPARNNDGSYYYIPKLIREDQTTQQKIYGNYNILNELENGGQDVKNKSLNLTASLNWEILPNLRYTCTGGLTTTTNLTESWMGEKSFYAASLRGYDYGAEPPIEDYATYLPDGGLWSNSSTNQYSFLWRNQLNYNFTVKENHHFNIDLGHEMSSVQYRGQSSGPFPGYVPEQGESFIPVWAGDKQEAQNYYWFLRYWFMGQGNVKARTMPTITDRTDNKLSFYMTSTYTYKNLFSVNFNIRNDGSNRFGQYESEKFNPVWSVSGRVNLNEFTFFNPEIIDLLAIRGSYGYRGSVPSATPYLIISQPKKNSTTGEMSAQINEYPNSNLKWEKTSTINFGIDYSLWRGRITGALDAYYSKSTDLISMRSASLVNGTSTLYYNDGTATNTGIEFSISTINIDTKDFKWRTSFSYSWNKNVVKQGSVSDNTYTDYLNGTVVHEGSSIDGFFSYKFAGLDSYGLPRFEGLTELPTGLSRDEYFSQIFTFSGSRTPTSYGSFSTEVSWKQFTFRAEFSYKLGYKQRLLQLYQEGNPALPMPEKNMNSAFVNRWRQPGDEAFTSIPGLTNINLNMYNPQEPPAPGEEYKYIMGDSEYRGIGAPTEYTGWFMYDYSDERVVKGDHIRLRAITLGYTVPPKFIKRLGLSNLRFDIQAQNLAVFAFDKKLKGQDPDQVSSIGLPVLPTYNFSINVSL